jgi:hypothetical protein
MALNSLADSLLSARSYNRSGFSVFFEFMLSSGHSLNDEKSRFEFLIYLKNLFDHKWIIDTSNHPQFAATALTE